MVALCIYFGVHAALGCVLLGVGVAQLLRKYNLGTDVEYAQQHSLYLIED